MRFHGLSLVGFLALASCGGEPEVPVSEPAPPSVDFGTAAPEVLTEWPCPPFEEQTTIDKVDDDDGDTLTDCVEELLGSDPNNADSDGDGVSDGLESADLAQSCIDPEANDYPRPCLDTDLDGVFDLVDPDDDGDRVPTRDEDAVPNGGNGDGDPRNDDVDGDGIANYVDDDDDNDLLGSKVVVVDGQSVVVFFEDSNDDGDSTNDDEDGDGVPNRLDPDDDGDTAPTREEDTNSNLFADEDDVDGDGIPNWKDLDDDGDGILTIDEDWDGSGSILDDNVDGDALADYQDYDEDGDSLDLPDELPITLDTDGDGIPNYRDNDDDNDLVPTVSEDYERYSDSELGTPVLDEDGNEIEQENNVLDDDTDGDGLLNHLDADDDGDGCPTALEGDGEDLPIEVDSDGDEIPDFLDTDSATCEIVPTTFTLTVNGLNFDASYDGLTVNAVVRDGVGAVSGQVSTVTAGLFSLVFPDALTIGAGYTVDLLIDEDGTCGGGTKKDPEIEGTWRLVGVTATAETLVVDVDGATAVIDPAACESF